MVWKLLNEQNLELTMKLDGVILRKAEFLNDFTGVYNMIFERMEELGETEGDMFLAILGEIGG